MGELVSPLALGARKCQFESGLSDKKGDIFNDGFLLVFSA